MCYLVSQLLYCIISVELLTSTLCMYAMAVKEVNNYITLQLTLMQYTSHLFHDLCFICLTGYARGVHRNKTKEQLLKPC